MTRFSWLQSRTQTVTVAALLGALAVVAAITGIQLSHLYMTEVAHCQTGCDLAINDFGHHQAFLQHALDILAMAAPALLGIFWGAPLLARELETGTYRLAWTQSVSRSRWLVTKIGVGAGMTVAVAGLLTLTITWWYRALDHVGSNQYDLFERRDIAPIGYAAFAFAAGVLLGAVIRRVVPAMAATLAIFIGARVAVAIWLRPHLLSPLHKSVSLLGTDGFGFASSNGGPITLMAKASAGVNTWTQSTHIVTSGGHTATSAQLSSFIQQHCPAIANPPAVAPGLNHPVKADPAGAASFEACRQQAAKMFHLVLTYQPASRYWALQWLECSIFLALAVMAVGASYWWLTRRAR
jgi:hypothetical protein